MESLCELCTRVVGERTKHHLIPQSKGGKKGDVAWICLQCSRQIHCIHPNSVLKNLNTIEKLKSDTKIKSYLDWVKNKPVQTFKTKQSWR